MTHRSGTTRRSAVRVTVGALLVVGAMAPAGGCAATRERDPALAASEARVAAWLARAEGRPQARSLSCEARSAADLLAIHGRRGTEEEVLGRLPRSDNPDLGFVGDVDGPSGRLPPEGYGVHEEPIARALVELGLPARAVRGVDLAWLGEETAAGRPVIAWVTGSCTRARPVELRDGAGRAFRAVRGEHTMLVLQVTRREVVVLDPADGRRARYDRDEFDAAWSLLGRRAVTTAPEASTPRDDPPR